MWVVTLPEIVFVPMSQSHAWLWHVSCDISWDSLCANATITCLIVTCELWHCLEQSWGQTHNQDFVWLWHWRKDSRSQCHMSHVTIRRLIVTLAQRLFQAMSQLTCHNQASDCDIGPKTVPGNVTTHMSQLSVWLWHWPKDSSRQCHNSHVTIKRLIVILPRRLFQAFNAAGGPLCPGTQRK